LSFRAGARNVGVKGQLEIWLVFEMIFFKLFRFRTVLENARFWGSVTKLQIICSEILSHVGHS